MNKIGLEEFQRVRRTLERRPLKENKDLLYRVGLYYQVSLPSEIDLEYIEETERFLNELYNKGINEFLPNAVQIALEDTLGISSSLSFAIKRKDFSPATFTNVKRLGRAIISISYGIS